MKNRNTLLYILNKVIKCELVINNLDNMHKIISLNFNTTNIKINYILNNLFK